MGGEGRKGGKKAESLLSSSRLTKGATILASSTRVLFKLMQPLNLSGNGILVILG